jgi:hypothetical protein
MCNNYSKPCGSAAYNIDPVTIACASKDALFELHEKSGVYITLNQLLILNYLSLQNHSVAYASIRQLRIGKSMLDEALPYLVSLDLIEKYKSRYLITIAGRAIRQRVHNTLLKLAS